MLPGALLPENAALLGNTECVADKNISAITTGRVRMQRVMRPHRSLHTIPDNFPCDDRSASAAGSLLIRVSRGGFSLEGIVPTILTVGLLTNDIIMALHESGIEAHEDLDDSTSSSSTISACLTS